MFSCLMFKSCRFLLNLYYFILFLNAFSKQNSPFLSFWNVRRWCTLLNSLLCCALIAQVFALRAVPAASPACLVTQSKLCRVRHGQLY